MLENLKQYSPISQQFGSPRGLPLSVHAEQNAIIQANANDLSGAILYLYGEENGIEIEAKPCDICRRMIVNSGIREVINNEKNN